MSLQTFTDIVHLAQAGIVIMLLLRVRTLEEILRVREWERRDS